MDFNSTSFWDVLLWSFWFFILISVIMIWFRCVVDLFSDHTLGGFAKFLWVVFFIFLPWLAIFVYLIARGKSMGERQMSAMATQQAAQEQYIQQVAAKTATPADQIANAKSLLDSGAITPAEFEAMKAKALA
ncbi:MAG TPA: SHOCT domain-containing protein [Dermatophilaceae bacterium]|nr:SHOCT domain-containing protein [Dermatophilaceae bacterium]